MVSARLTRLRWRRRGAWMWPAFLAMTLLDGLIGHLLPPAGQGQRLGSALLVGLFANLFAIVVLAWPVSLLLRRRRPDLPRVVARDYGGTLAIAAITLIILAVGLVHRPVLLADRAAAADAMARAEAYIGDRAPPPFRRDANLIDSYAIEPGHIYRECVPSTGGRRSYCVIVDTDKPLQRSVSFSGYESNETMFQGFN